jgi:hypothetical protein
LNECSWDYYSYSSQGPCKPPIELQHYPEQRRSRSLGLPAQRYPERRTCYPYDHSNPRGIVAFVA